VSVTQTVVVVEEGRDVVDGEDLSTVARQ